MHSSPSVLLLLLGCFIMDHTSQALAEKNLSTVSYQGFEAPVCGNASCRGRCGDKDAAYCACDEHCMILGICCIDYQAECVTNTSFESSNITQEFLERYTVQKASRCGYPGVVGQLDPYTTRLIHKCPIASPYQELCENVTYEDLSLDKLLAVYSTSSMLLFKNQYCAACHGFQDWVPTEMTVKAVVSRIKQVVRTAKVHGTNGILKVINKELNSRTLLNGAKVRFSFNLQQLPLSLVRLRCTPLKVSKDERCEHNFIDLVGEFIDSYRSPVGYKEEHESCNHQCLQTLISSNWHEKKYDCLAYAMFSEKFECLRYEEIKSDFSAYHDRLVVSHSGVRYYVDHVFCNYTQIADMMSNECVSRPCPIGSRHVAGACHAVSSDPIIPTALTADTLHIALVLAQDQSQPNFAELRQFFAWQIQVEWKTLSCSALTEQPNAFCALISLHGLPANLLFDMLSNKFRRENIFNLIQNSLHYVSSIGLLNYDPLAELTCPRGELERSDNVSMLTDTVFALIDTLEANVVKVVRAKSFITYSVDMVAIQLLWSVDASGGESVQYRGQQVSVAACTNNTSLETCDTALLLSHQYKAEVTDQTIKLTLVDSRKSFKIPAVDTITTDKKTLILCKTTLQQALNTACASLNISWHMSLAAIIISALCSRMNL